MRYTSNIANYQILDFSFQNATLFQIIRPTESSSFDGNAHELCLLYKGYQIKLTIKKNSNNETLATSQTQDKLYIDGIDLEDLLDSHKQNNDRVKQFLLNLNSSSANNLPAHTFITSNPFH